MTVKAGPPNNAESVECQYCGRLVVLGGYKGRLQTLLEHHQKSRECLLAQSEILRCLTEKSHDSRLVE